MTQRPILILAAGLLVIGGFVAFFYLTAKPTVEAPAPSPRVDAPVRSASPSPVAPEPSPIASAKPTPKAAEPSPTPEPSPTTGTLLIESDVPDTSVFVDRVYLGKAPATAAGLTPGPHRLNLSASGYEGFVDTIDVAAGTHTFSYSFKEIRLNASIAVTHKHGIGSCSGTLRATPKGLVYETTNTGDAFSAALTDLDTFTVDYLEKNLKVKIKGGKTYNFTDAGGDVNRLYLFHQDVDKARQRLLEGR